MKRNKFSLSNTKLFTCDMGELIPCGLQEVLPGDSFQMSTSLMVRSMPMVAPPIHPVDVRIHHWYVPMRLLWDSWQDFITGGPTNSNASVFPTITLASGAGIGGLSDYLGIPTGVNNIQFSALPLRAYALIWNEWYRDQDLQSLLPISKADGNDTTTNTTLQNCDWEKDFSTSARPWEQKGPTVTLPLGTSAPLKLNPASGAIAPTISRKATDGTVHVSASNAATTATGQFEWGTSQAALDVTPHTIADLSTAAGATVNQFRTLIAVQRYAEARARYGSRYTEYLAYLGVKSSDARLQRPEYLGGGKQTIQFSEILQTAADGTNPVGTLRGHGLSALRSNRFRKFFEEHGFIITMMSVRPKTMYSQGMKKIWNYRIKEDFWQKELEHVGQAPVLNKEIYAAHASPDGVFGYQDRYDQYRRQESTIAGLMRTTFAQWHFGRQFGSQPALNGTYVSCVPPKTPFADQANDNTLVMAKHSIQARRLVSQVGTSFTF